MDEKVAKFIRAYSQVPEELRNQIIVTIDGKPYTWNSALFQVKTESKIAKKILNTLSTMSII